MSQRAVGCHGLARMWLRPFLSAMGKWSCRNLPHCTSGVVANCMWLLFCWVVCVCGSSTVLVNRGWCPKGATVEQPKGIVQLTGVVQQSEAVRSHRVLCKRVCECASVGCLTRSHTHVVGARTRAHTRTHTHSARSTCQTTTLPPRSCGGWMHRALLTTSALCQYASPQLRPPPLSSLKSSTSPGRC